MQLNLQTDVSLRILMHLGVLPSDSKTTIAELSELFQVSKNHMVKIINKLGKAGYLTNVRGKGGGIYLAKSPQDINIADVILAIENNTEVVDCTKNYCPFIGACKLKSVLDDASNSFFKHIAQYSLADIVSTTPSIKPPQ